MMPAARLRRELLRKAPFTHFRDGEDLHRETVAKYVTFELAYTVWIERVKAKVGTREDTAQTALRVTMIFRPEDGAWKVVHRHADPITTTKSQQNYPWSELPRSSS
jgi:ketosteroid isomerase-like protein